MAEHNNDNEFADLKQMLEDHNNLISGKIDDVNRDLMSVSKTVNDRLDRHALSLNQMTGQLGEVRGEITSLRNNTRDQWEKIGMLEIKSVSGNGNRSYLERLAHSPGVKWVMLPIILVIIGLFGWNLGDLWK